MRLPNDNLSPKSNPERFIFPPVKYVDEYDDDVSFQTETGKHGKILEGSFGVPSLDLGDVLHACHNYCCYVCMFVQSMKTYQLYHGEFLQAENKLRHAENQRIKIEQQQNVGGVVGAKTAISRRFRNYEKLSEKVSWDNVLYYYLLTKFDT